MVLDEALGEPVERTELIQENLRGQWVSCKGRWPVRASIEGLIRWQSSAGLTLLEGIQEAVTSFQQVYLWKGELQGGEAGVTERWLPKFGPSLYPQGTLLPVGDKMQTYVLWTSLLWSRRALPLQQRRLII